MIARAKETAVSHSAATGIAGSLLAFLIVLFVLSGCSTPAQAVDLWQIPLGDATNGQAALQEYGCITCHVIPGVPGAQGKVGPPLTDWSERHYIAGTLPNEPNNLIYWIMNPQEIRPGTVMPDMGVSEDDARDIAAYLYTLGRGLRMRDQMIDQPVAFSHQFHVEGLGIDCRYCHTAVTESPFAGMPSTHTCMGCHSQVLVDSALLAPVRVSWQEGAPIPWVRLQNMLDTVRLDHASHVRAGVGCDTCHGRIDQMLVTEAAVSWTMDWCLECHRNPEPYLRPRAEVFNPEWVAPPHQETLGAELVHAYGIQKNLLTDCSLCHQ